LVFRLDFVTSAFHRGKIGIMFEPNHYHVALIDANISLNKNNILIVDIANTNSIEFSVNWASTFPWLKTYSPSSIRAAQNNDSAVVANQTDYVNGYIVIFPIVPLQSPDDSDIDINIFVRAGSLLLQQMRDDLPTDRMYITPESYVTSDISDEKSLRMTLNPTTANVTDITKHYFGEQPVSFRACLKRYVSQPVVNISPGGTHEGYYLTRVNIPEPSPAYNTEDAVPNLYGYLRYAYIGLRGSTRFRFRSIEYTALSKRQSAVVVSLNEPVQVAANAAASSTGFSFLYQRGSISFLPFTNGGIEYEIPFYCQNDFVFSFADDLMGPDIVDGEMSVIWSKTHQIFVESPGSASHDKDNFFLFATGEDFTLLNYNGAPYYTYEEV
jgi:hypothetical protein